MSEVTLAAPLAGWLMSVRDVPDPVFSEEMMGVGFAIDPTEGRVVAPCPAEVLLVAPTQHSVTLRTETGAELLIHVGLETVALEGRGFEAHVREGARVAAGDLLIAFDIDAVGLEAKSLVTPIVLTNAEQYRLKLQPFDRLVNQGEALGSVEGESGVERAEAADARTATREAVVRFEHGLHARPAARIADAAKRFAGEVTLLANGKSANARSPVAIMALDIKHGDRVSLVATGEHGERALDEVATVLEAGERAAPAVARAAPARTLAANEIAGLCAVPGTAVGTAVRWHRKTSAVSEQGRGPERETAAFEEALATSAARLRAVAAEVGGAGSEVAEAHIGLLEDDDLRETALARIAEGKSAGFAWQSATGEAADALRRTANPRMRERIADLQDVCSQVLNVLAGGATGTRSELPEGAILVADDLLPSELLSLDRSRLAGIALEGGGATSHMAIIAASLRLPTVVALGTALARVADGTRVLLDGTAGKLAIDPDEDTIGHALARAREIEGSAGECETRDGEHISLLANLGGLAEVEAAVAAGAEGCGLLRTEFLFLDRSEAPPADEQAQTYQAIADALGGRPLTIRTLDIGGDKPVPFIDFGHEENPALGARGVRTRLVQPRLMEEQLRAIAQVRSDALKVMVPMVSSVAELRTIREQLTAIAGGKPIKLGAMVETPAAALLADGLASEADFLSIGTNDLAQYALAMDRTNARLAPLIDALHPAVLRLIAMTAEAGQRTGTPVSVCGNLASDPAGALLLIGLGITELSGAPAAFPLVRHAVAQVSAAECRQFAQSALKCESAAEVRALAAELLERRNDQGVEA